MGSPTASSAAVYQQMQQMQQLLQTGTPGGAAAALEAAAAAALPALNESQSEMAAVIDNMEMTDVQMTGMRDAPGQNLCNECHKTTGPWVIWNQDCR